MKKKQQVRERAQSESKHGERGTVGHTVEKNYIPYTIEKI